MRPDVAAVLLVVGLFLIGVLSPGPNFLVVVERSMTGGFRAGAATGLGVATGDALYAGCGLVGLATLVAQAGWLFGLAKTLGGMYIAWLGVRMLWRSLAVPPDRDAPPPQPPPAAVALWRCYRTGLLTDLANPKTAVFFAGIFTAAYDPALPVWTAAAMWAGIVMSSAAWRIGVAAAFSRRAVQSLYRRTRRPLEMVFGGILLAIGARLAIEER